MLRPTFRGLAISAILVIVLAACSTFKEARERLSTFAEETVEVNIDSIHVAVMDILPQFHLIATSGYADAALIEARGDWGSPNEGAIVKISIRADGDKAHMVVEAGQSTFESKERKRELAQRLMEALVSRLQGRASESHP